MLKRIRSQRRPNSRRDFGIPVVIGILILSSILGFFAFKNYLHSEKTIMADIQEMQKKAPHLTLEQCADEVMVWYKSCHVMQNLCDDSVMRLTDICILEGNKQEQCHLYGDALKDYKFGTQECFSRGFTKGSAKKACGNVYQAIADYCRASQK